MSAVREWRTEGEIRGIFRQETAAMEGRNQERHEENIQRMARIEERLGAAQEGIDILRGAIHEMRGSFDRAENRRRLEDGASRERRRLLGLGKALAVGGGGWAFHAVLPRLRHFIGF